MATSRSISIVLPCILGIAAGLAGSFVMSRRSAGGQREASPANAVAVPAARDVMRTDPARPQVHPESMRALERRIAELEARNPPDPGPSLAMSSAMSSPEAIRAEHRRLHEEAIAEHRREPTDPAWATRSSADLSAQLGEISHANGFQLVDVDCRTTTCTAEFEWPSYAAAVEHYTDILHGVYRVNCMRRILLPEPDDVALRYRATAVFDCTSWRAAGEPSI